MDKFAEIKKLDRMLAEANIPHTFEPFPLAEGYQIRVYANEAMTHELDDAICHTYSHGYVDGLLETFSLNKCEGWETAEQVFEGWKEMYEKAQISA